MTNDNYTVAPKLGPVLITSRDGKPQTSEWLQTELRKAKHILYDIALHDDEYLSLLILEAEKDICKAINYASRLESKQ